MFFFSKTDEEKANLNGHIPATEPVQLHGTRQAETRTISLPLQELRVLPTVRRELIKLN